MKGNELKLHVHVHVHVHVASACTVCMYRRACTLYCTRWHVRSDIEDCEGWLSPGGHSSGGRALTAKVRGPGSIPGGCRFFTVL